MLRESYKRNIKKLREANPNVKVIDVAVSSNSPLSPSIELASDYRFKKITRDEFVGRFKEEMSSSAAKAEMLKIAKQAVNEEVYLVCNDNKQDCHRFILMDMIEELANKNDIPVKIVKTNNLK